MPQKTRIRSCFWLSMNKSLQLITAPHQLRMLKKNEKLHLNRVVKLNPGFEGDFILRHWQQKFKTAPARRRDRAQDKLPNDFCKIMIILAFKKEEEKNSTIWTQIFLQAVIQPTLMILTGDMFFFIFILRFQLDSSKYILEDWHVLRRYQI